MGRRLSYLARRIAATAVVLVGVTAGCSQNAGKMQAGESVAIGSTKADLFGMPAEFRALHPRLEECFGQPVRFNAQANGRAIGIQLEQGNIAYAILTAGEYAALPNPQAVQLVAVGVNELGKTTRQAHIIARASDKRLQTVKDCSGKRFAFGTYGDPLTDVAARKALEEAGVPPNKLLPEILPPPFAMEGRLYVQKDAPLKISLDLTVNAGVVDEVAFNKLPETGGNPITGPSRDQFRILGETTALPEIAVVAGPAAKPEQTERLRQYLIESLKDDAKVCEQLGVKGFAEPDAAAFEQARSMLAKS